VADALDYGEVNNTRSTAVSGGVDEKFASFYEEHRADVFRTAYLITTDHEEARDLTQETFARAFQHWEVVSKHERPGAWLQTVVGRSAISWRRRQAVRSRFVSPDEVVITADPDEPTVLRALRSLTAAQRTVLVLRFYADNSVEEVSRILKKRPGTVKALTSQALARIRPILEAKGVRP
jgi:RNA polymerase sigma factor (sigma-70 family)